MNSRVVSSLIKLITYAVVLYLLVQVGAAVVGLAVALLPYIIVFAAVWFFLLKPKSKG